MTSSYLSIPDYSRQVFLLILLNLIDIIWRCKNACYLASGPLKEVDSFTCLVARIAQRTQLGARKVPMPHLHTQSIAFCSQIFRLLFPGPRSWLFTCASITCTVRMLQGSHALGKHTKRLTRYNSLHYCNNPRRQCYLEFAHKSSGA